MKKFRQFIVLTLCLLTVLVCSRAEGQESYLWPTNASRLLTSAFGEYRPDRFHAGIDIKTWNRTGYKVFAIDDGYILRLRVSPFGYGRAVYQKLKTGEIAVYAHLDRFSPEIEDIIAREQNKRQRFSVDLWLKPDVVPVKKGDIIAYSGRTGTRLPHLHFELRDASNRPINPLARGFEAVDNAPPVPAKLGIRTFSYDAHVNGDMLPVVLRPEHVSGNEFRLRSPVTAWGEIGLSVDAYDVNGEYDNRYGIYKLRLLVNGQDKFSASFDRYNYSENRLVNLDRDYRFLREDLGKFYNLYIKPGNTLPFYGKHKQGDGVLRMNGQNTGLVPFEIVLTDYYGNESRLHGEFKIEPLSGLNNFPSVTASTSGAADSLAGVNKKRVGRFRIRPVYMETFLRLSIKTGADLSAPPAAVILSDGKPPQPVEIIAKSRRNFLAAIPYSQVDGSSVSIRISGESVTHTYESVMPVDIVHVPVQGRRIYLKNNSGTLQIDRGDLFEDIWLRQSIESPGSLSDDYDIAGNIVHLAPKEIPLQSDVHLTMTYPVGDPRPDKLGIYARDNEGEWHYLGQDLDPVDRTLSISLSSLETVAAIRDTVPPVITRISPEDNAAVEQKRPVVTAWFDDELSGIGDEDDLEMYVDERKVIAEWDPILKKIFFAPRRDFITGTHTVRFVVRDRVGNTAETSWRFIVR